MNDGNMQGQTGENPELRRVKSMREIEEKHSNAIRRKSPAPQQFEDVYSGRSDINFYSLKQKEAESAGKKTAQPQNRNVQQRKPAQPQNRNVQQRRPAQPQNRNTQQRRPVSQNRPAQPQNRNAQQRRPAQPDRAAANQVKPNTKKAPQSKEELLESKKRKEKIRIAVFSCLIVLLIGVIGTGIWFMHDLTKGIQFTDEGTDKKAQKSEDSGFGVYEENLSFKNMADIISANSLRDYLDKWQTNGGELIHSKNVTNVLLIGEDGDATEDQNGRSDCIMLISINRKDKKIVMTSFMRDSYCRYETEDGAIDYGKINSSCFYGGYKGLVNAVESLYKVDIDYYLSVNFNSFPGLINALGGVNVPIQEYEAKYINRTTRYTVNYGDSVKLNGDEALVFCRIRHCDSDSDVSRTRRQRETINALMQSAKGATKGQLLNAIKKVSPYIKTNMPSKTLISFGTAALVQDWMSFPMTEYTFPDEDTRIDATISSQSCWVIDYVRAAQKVQKNIYGISNIVLDNEHHIPLETLKTLGENTSYYYY